MLQHRSESTGLEFAVLDDGAAVPQVEHTVASLAATWIKLNLQPGSPSVPPDSPHEVRPVHAPNIVPKGTNVERTTPQRTPRQCPGRILPLVWAK